MGGSEEAYVKQAFDSNFVAPLGPQLSEFEERFAAYLGKSVHCVGMSSGSAALHLALHMLELDSDDEVWVSSMTFAGGCFPILYERAEPVFVDLAGDSWTLCPDLLEEALKKAARAGKLPKAVVPTDLYGMGCDLQRLEDITRQFGVKLIVDSAESAGASVHGRKCGSGGDVSILSFNGNKIITTSGGGMLVSSDASVVDRARFLATQARDPAPHYEHSVYGFNYRMSNVSAAIGLGQLEVLDQRVEQRRSIFAKYAEAFAHLPGIQFMPEPDWSHGSRWLSALTIDPDMAGVSREQIRCGLLEHEIESRPLWKPMHMQPLFRGARYIGAGFDQSLFEKGLCLPSSSDMTADQQDEVITRVRGMLEAQL
jgi:pyridoxal phosphate-dependent aminotransferase EpsN